MGRWRWLVAILIGVAVLVGAYFVVVNVLLGDDSRSGPECVVQPDPTMSTQTTVTVSLADSAAGIPALTSADALSLTAVQLQYASTINAVGLRKEVPDRGRVIALATAMQESSLRNLSTGDLDSVGLFQQRPSQGWGTVAEIMDPVYAAGVFYDRLLELPDWESMELTDAAQQVQYSAHPNAYAKWEDAATSLTDALSNQWYMVISCREGAVAPTTEAPDRVVLPGSESAAVGLQELLAAADAELGGVTVDGVADGGRSATVSAAVPGFTADRAAAVLSAWMVAHATAASATDVAVSSYRWTEHAWTSPAGPVPAGQVTVIVAEGSGGDAPPAGGY